MDKALMAILNSIEDVEILKTIRDIVQLKIDNVVDGNFYYSAWVFSNIKYQKTWEYREPKQWEIYLSWAKPEAYPAFHGLDDKYFILKRI